MALTAGSYYFSPAVWLAIHIVFFSLLHSTLQVVYGKEFLSATQEHLESIIINPGGSAVALCRALASYLWTCKNTLAHKVTHYSPSIFTVKFLGLGFLSVQGNPGWEEPRESVCAKVHGESIPQRSF